MGLVSSVENTLSEYAERFSEISHFSPALSIHQIPLFNTLSGYGSYVFPAVAPLIIHQTIFLGLSMLIALYRESRQRINLTTLFGISLAILTIGCLGCYYLFGFTFWYFDYPRGGNFWGMLLAVPIFVFCMIGITTLFASFLDMPERAGHIIVLLRFRSLCFQESPGRMLPCQSGSTHWASLTFDPNRADVYSTQSDGVPTYMVLGKLAYLLVIGIICMSLGYYRLRPRS